MRRVRTVAAMLLQYREHEPHSLCTRGLDGALASSPFFDRCNLSISSAVRSGDWVYIRRGETLWAVPASLQGEVHNLPVAISDASLLVQSANGVCFETGSHQVVEVHATHGELGRWDLPAGATLVGATRKGPVAVDRDGDWGHLHDKTLDLEGAGAVLGCGEDMVVWVNPRTPSTLNFTLDDGSVATHTLDYLSGFRISTSEVLDRSWVGTAYSGGRALPVLANFDDGMVELPSPGYAFSNPFFFENGLPGMIATIDLDDARELGIETDEDDEFIRLLWSPLEDEATLWDGPHPLVRVHDHERIELVAGVVPTERTDALVLARGEDASVPEEARTAATLIKSRLELLPTPVNGSWRIGMSKIGGNPDLAGEWPALPDQEAPLPFVMQIDLADVALFCELEHLPSEGLLSVFSALQWGNNGYAVQDRALAAVVITPPGETLTSREPTMGVPVAPEWALSFNGAESLPPPEVARRALLWNSDKTDRYREFLTQQAQSCCALPKGCSKIEIGAWPGSWWQHDEALCAAVLTDGGLNDLPVGAAISVGKHPLLRALAASSEDWRVLLAASLPAGVLVQTDARNLFVVGRIGSTPDTWRVVLQ